MSRFAAIAAAVSMLIGVLGVYAAGHRAGRQGCEAAHAGQAAAARKATARILEARADVTGRLDLAHQAKAEQLRVVYRTIYRSIPDVLPPETDARFPLPVGLVRLHDAAALGVPAVPDTAGRADDQPSPVAASRLAGAVVDNYEICHSTAGQLTDLQAWVREQAAISLEGGQ